MTITTNQHPRPIDSRHVHNAGATQAADPIRDTVTGALKEAGITTNGKTDAALLADYTKMLRDQHAQALQAQKATAATNAAKNEFAGYSINQLIDKEEK